MDSDWADIFDSFDVSYKISSMLTNAFFSFYYGNHGEDVGSGFEALEKFKKTRNLEHLKSAFILFSNVEDDDRDFVKGGAAYRLAICNAYAGQFNSAYKCLEKIDAIEVKWYTVKKDTVAYLKKAAPELKTIIKKVEREYWREKGCIAYSFHIFVKSLKWLLLLLLIIGIAVVALSYFGVIHIDWLNPLLDFIPGYRHGEMDSVSPFLQYEEIES